MASMVFPRRRFLQYFGAGAAAASMPSRASLGTADAVRVGIVGGGIVGASIAFHLARMGARVIVFEKEHFAAGATRASFAWINTSSPDEHYARLRMQSVFAWRSLDQQLPLNVSWGGTVMWSQSGGGLEDDAPWFLKALGKSYDPAAYPKNVVDAQQLASIAPAIAVPPDFDSGLHIPMDGHADPVYCTQQLFSAARNYGAEFVMPCEVEDFEFSEARLAAVLTTKGRFELDRVLLAGGTETPRLTAKVGYEMPLKHEPGISAHSKPLGPISNLVAMNGNGVLAKQLPDGRIIASDADHPPHLESGVHSGILAGPTEMPPALGKMHGNRVLRKVAEQVFPAAAGAELEELIVGYRPLPEDGFPIVGALDATPDIYVATMHSGVTLAPIMGQYVTRELLGNVSVDMLEPYRPGRFAA